MASLVGRAVVRLERVRRMGRSAWMICIFVEMRIDSNPLELVLSKIGRVKDGVRMIRASFRIFDDCLV